MDTQASMTRVPTKKTPPMKFFGLKRTAKKGVVVESDDTLLGISNNPILREHARQYDLETAAFATGRGARGSSR